jgi:hypothetical protein
VAEEHNDELGLKGPFLCPIPGASVSFPGNNDQKAVQAQSVVFGDLRKDVY